MSLQSRLDIICDEADGDSGINLGIESDETSAEKPISQFELQLLRKGCSLPFPRRVFAPWLGETLVCDYLQPSETIEVLKEHCLELLSMKAPTDISTILEPEKEVLTLETKSFWDVAVSANSKLHRVEDKNKHEGTGHEDKNSGKSVKSGQIKVVPACLIVLLSILVGFVLFFLKA